MYGTRDIDRVTETFVNECFASKRTAAKAYSRQIRVIIICKNYFIYKFASGKFGKTLSSSPASAFNQQT